MIYMTDAHLSGLAKELREKGIDCETVHKLDARDEDSRIKITDPEIVKFLASKNKSVALITLDNELAEYCSTFDIPVIRVQDLVSKHIQASGGPGDGPSTGVERYRRWYRNAFNAESGLLPPWQRPTRSHRYHTRTTLWNRTSLSRS